MLTKKKKKKKKDEAHGYEGINFWREKTVMVILPLKHKNSGARAYFFVSSQWLQRAAILHEGWQMCPYLGAAIKLHEAAKRCAVMRLPVK